MAATKTIDYWRDYFRDTNCDIFEVIEYSILVASSDCPKEFRLRRDRIAQLLYSSSSSCRCAGSYHRDVSPHHDDQHFTLKSRPHGCNSRPVGSKESKVNRSSRDDDRGESNYNTSFHGGVGGGVNAEAPSDEIEALSDEIEEQSQAVEEVQRIKQILINSQYESESILYESLRRLQLMELTVGTLKVTGIGKAVNHLRKHGTKQIARLSQTLISGWKTIVDEWFKTAPAVAAPEPNCTPDSVNPSVVEEEEYEEEEEQDKEVEEGEEEEEGLPSPPMDEEFFAAQTGPMELSQFFDGMGDDDANPQSSGRFNKNRGNGPKPSPENNNFVQPRTQQKLNRTVRDSGYQQMRKREDAIQPNTPLNMRPNVEQRVGESQLKHKRLEQTLVKRRQLDNGQQGIKHSEMKLEATKRKLQESYQQVEKAKKQRTVQVMDLHNLPDQAPRGQSNPHVRSGIQSRRLVNGRR